jgi:hypothetical protein
VAYWRDHETGGLDDDVPFWLSHQAEAQNADAVQAEMSPSSPAGFWHIMDRKPGSITRMQGGLALVDCHISLWQRAITRRGV